MSTPRERGGPPRPAVAAALGELAREGPLAAVVRGGSMAPPFADGERVEIAPARWAWPGDVVAFRAADGRIVVHRVLGFRLHGGRLALVTRGDAAPRPDPPVAPDCLLGRVRARVGVALRLRSAGSFIALAAAGAARRLRRP